MNRVFQGLRALNQLGKKGAGFMLVRIGSAHESPGRFAPEKERCYSGEQIENDLNKDYMR